MLGALSRSIFVSDDGLRIWQETPSVGGMEEMLSSFKRVGSDPEIDISADQRRPRNC